MKGVNQVESGFAPELARIIWSTLKGLYGITPNDVKGACQNAILPNSIRVLIPEENRVQQ